jgi:uncharacterized damage-inducible protein DinB
MHRQSRTPVPTYTATMSTYLGRLIGYGTWANQGLLDFLASQPPEVLDLTSNGVYGTIRATLEHLLTSEMGYQNRLLGLPRFDFSGRPERASLTDLQTLADESAARLASLEAALPAPGAMLTTGDGDRAAATIMTQLVMHGVEHRAHVGTILGANGIEPPDLDAWAHGTFVHSDAWPSDWGPEPAERRLPFSR